MRRKLEDELHLDGRRSWVVGAAHVDISLGHQGAAVKAGELDNHVLSLGKFADDIIVDHDLPPVLDAEGSKDPS